MERERDMEWETDCVYVVGTHADRKIKKVGEKGPVWRLIVQRAIRTSVSLLITSHLQYLLKGRWHRLEWDGFSCVTLNNRGLCICRKGENQYAVVICVFPSISVHSAFLIHFQKFIVTYTDTSSPIPTVFFCFPLCRPPWSQAFQFVCGNRSRAGAFICMKMR